MFYWKATASKTEASKPCIIVQFTTMQLSFLLILQPTCFKMKILKKGQSNANSRFYYYY